jgi:hypothetical protein
MTSVVRSGSLEPIRAQSRRDGGEAIVIRVPRLRRYQACSVPQCGQSTEVVTVALKAKPHMHE